MSTKGLTAVEPGASGTTSRPFLIAAALEVLVYHLPQVFGLRLPFALRVSGRIRGEIDEVREGKELPSVPTQRTDQLRTLHFDTILSKAFRYGGIFQQQNPSWPPNPIFHRHPASWMQFNTSTPPSPSPASPRKQHGNLECCFVRSCWPSPTPWSSTSVSHTAPTASSTLSPTLAQSQIMTIGSQGSGRRC